MKKVLLFVAIIGLIITTSNAQPRSIGGGFISSYYGVEISYQHSIGTRNMVQVDLSSPLFLAIQGTATYNWVFPFNSWKKEGTWNWYAGVGGTAGAGFTGFGVLGATGQIGVEYNCSFPMQVYLNYRPTIGVAFNSHLVSIDQPGFYNFGVGLRYNF